MEIPEDLAERLDRIEDSIERLEELTRRLLALVIVLPDDVQALVQADLGADEET